MVSMKKTALQKKHWIVTITSEGESSIASHGFDLFGTVVDVNNRARAICDDLKATGSEIVECLIRVAD